VSVYIQRFRCDNGTGEYANRAFFKILVESGISYELSPSCCQNKNRVAERMSRTLNTKARALLLDTDLPMKFWGEAIRTACYLHRISPTTSLDSHISPHESLLGTKSKIYHLRRFGYTVYKHIPKAQRLEKNFADRSKPCMFRGYVHKSTTIWRIWDFSSNRAIECSNAICREDQNAFKAIHVGDVVKDIEFPLNIEGELMLNRGISQEYRPATSIIERRDISVVAVIGMKRCHCSECVTCST
jgi:hypothetical protein